MNNKINLGNICMNDTIREQLLLVENITDLAMKNGVKIWFNGTYGVVGYCGYFFTIPHDVDCGVLKNEYSTFKDILANNGYISVSEKDNGKFSVTTFEKDAVAVELGTFENDLGDNYANIENVRYPIPDSQWLASCYRITHTKARRQGKNDLERAIFLESLSNL